MSNHAEEDTHMADLPPYRTPRWVKIVGIIALVLVLLIGILLFTGVGGDHGPGRHLPSGAAGGGTPPIAYVIEDDGDDLPRGADGPADHIPSIEHGGQQP
jgi:hypothetical protein